MGALVQFVIKLSLSKTALNYTTKVYLSHNTGPRSLPSALGKLWGLLQKKTRPNYDSVPEGYQLVYRTGLENYVIYPHAGFLTGFAITGLYVGSTMAFNALYGLPLFSSLSFLGQDQNLAESSLELGGYVAGLGLLFLPAQIIFQRTPLRIYYSNTEDKFLAFYANYLPFSTRTQVFLPGRIVPPKDTSSEVLWFSIQHTYLGNGDEKQKILLFGESFSQPFYYNHLLGYKQ